MKNIENIDKKNPFKVPDNYFEDFNRRIIEATAVREEVKPERGIIRRLRPYFAAAASIAVLVALGYTAVWFNGNKNNVLEFPEMSINELPDSYLNDIDILTLEENVASSGFFEENSGVDVDDIIDYLMLENIDDYDIYENL